jgi:hypothetical protein
MKHLLTILFLICTLSLFSQQNNLGQETDVSRIEALKIAYITKKLNLSPDEAQRFWPIYNNYANEMREVAVIRKGTMDPNLTLKRSISVSVKNTIPSFPGP